MCLFYEVKCTRYLDMIVLFKKVFKNIVNRKNRQFKKFEIENDWWKFKLQFFGF